MLINIPTELCPYVRMDRKKGLVHSSDMPKELLPLFRKTKKDVLAQQKKRMKELRALLVDEENE